MKSLIPALALAIALAPATGGAQEAQPQQPTFRATVDLVPVDVSVLDQNGRPVPDLAAGDFVLRVDGQPRRVASVQYIASTRNTVAPASSDAHYSSNAASAGGRMIMLAVDQGNIGTGRGRAVLESASRFIAALSPADRVGLVTLPGAGPQVDFTEHHGLVRTMLTKVIGQDSGFQTLHRIGVTEAAEIQRGNQLVLTEVINRECGLARGAELEICTRQVRFDAMSMYMLARERARSSLMGLRNALDRMAFTPSQKTIIYISEGLVIDRELSDIAWLTQAAARAQAVIYVLQLETPAFDASQGRVSPTTHQDRMLAQEGLGVLAGMTRGSVMRIVSSADYAFERLSQELSGYYLLSFEPEAGDRDGRSHRISVSVPGRDGASVRARSEFVVGEARVRSADELLAETIRAPLLASDIPLKLATYSLRDPVSSKMRIVFGVEIDRSGNATEQISVAYVLYDVKGNALGSRIVRNLPPLRDSAPRTQDMVDAVTAEGPGTYTLKFAVVDDHGRRGSVERTFQAQLATAGQVRVTDLMVGGRPTDDAERVRPTVSGEVSSDFLHGYLELYSDAVDVLENASVTIEVASSEGGSALDSAVARLRPEPQQPTRRTAEGVVPIALLPPGEYVARAVITVDGKKAGQVVRPFRVTKAANAPAAADAGPRPSRPPIPFVSRIDAFERESVLTPPVVGFFMERLNFGPSKPAGASTAVERARDGRFEEAIAALTSSGGPEVAVAFLQGLLHYSKGELEPAAAKFRETLKLDSEFFPAAFYLGSCYAAGGRDRQAVGAWQTSLVTESDAPFIYTLLADAFLRLREVESALGILLEARGLWPESDEVLLRLGTALAIGGRAGEALAVLDPYLLRNPGDHERHFIALRAIYEARRSGGVIRSVQEDRKLFERYAEAYKAAGGPQVPLVEEWRKFLDKAPGL